MRGATFPVLVLSVIGGAFLTLASVPGSAATIPTGAAQSRGILAEAPVVEQAAHRRYDPHRHGPRFRYRRDRYRYYHGGWYYAYPWWFYAVPPVVVVPPPLPPVYRSAHVRWCLERYRSYDVRTDTFLGYDGLRHRCRSPYQP